MIGFRDIKDSITLSLSEKFNIKVYDEQVKQGFDVPAFFIQAIPINTIRANFFTKNPTLMVDISYFPTIDSNDELYDMADILEKHFNFSIKVKDRIIHIKNIEYEIVDFVLHFQMNLDYLVSIRELVEPTENIQLMKDIKINTTGE